MGKRRDCDVHRRSGADLATGAGGARPPPLENCKIKIAKLSLVPRRHGLGTRHTHTDEIKMAVKRSSQKSIVDFFTVPPVFVSVKRTEMDSSCKYTITL